jgi:hypothetical protein
MIKILFIIILIIAFSYFGISFYILELNPFLWDKALRLVFMYLIVVFIFISLLIHIIIKL